MKLHIKTLAATFVAGLALVSCNNDFDESDLPTIKHAEKLSLGMWTREYTPADASSYTVNIALNEQGDTICDITTYDPETKLANVYSASKVTYNPQLGMTTAEIAEDAEGVPARATLTMASDKKHLIVNLYNVGQADDGSEELEAIDHFTTVQSDTISVLGRWQLADGTTIQLDRGGKASLVYGQDVLSEGTYTFSGHAGQAVINGTTYDFNFNAQNGQMTCNEKYASHVVTPLPDDWTEYALGTYNSTFSQSPIANAIIYYSPSRKSYRLNPLADAGFQLNYTPTPIQFTFTEPSKDENGETVPGVIKLKKRKGLVIGLSLQDYGQVFADAASNAEVDSWNTQAESAGHPEYKCDYAGYANDVFTFAWFYYTPSTQLGYYNETFVVSDLYEME